MQDVVRKLLNALHQAVMTHVVRLSSLIFVYHSAPIPYLHASTDILSFVKEFFAVLTVSVQICIFAFRMTKDAVLAILWQTFLYFNKISKLTGSPSATQQLLMNRSFIHFDESRCLFWL